MLYREQLIEAQIQNILVLYQRILTLILEEEILNQHYYKVKRKRITISERRNLYYLKIRVFQQAITVIVILRSTIALGGFSLELKRFDKIREFS